jgi:NAD(P)H-hydrate epimerase
MKLFPTSTISLIDQFTIVHEPISDIDLMERAAAELYAYIVDAELSGKIVVLCGPGNNGGDGLALARMLGQLPGRFQVSVYFFNFGRELANNTQINFGRLTGIDSVHLTELSENEVFPEFRKDEIVIDALFGSGLNRPLSGFAAGVVQKVNQSGATVISVDIPSGLMGEDNRHNSTENIVKANRTLTFQFPKISFLFPENECYVGEWAVLDIGLHPDAIKNTPSTYYFIDSEECKNRFRKRDKFSHKGIYGHALLVSGSYGKMGAAVLASKACLRAGSGLLTVHVPHETYQIIQTAVPEAMCDIDDSDLMFTGITNLELYSAVGIGPALGQKVNTQRGFRKLLDEISVPLVIDADAINILGLNPSWINDLPENTIITPHPKEFERIAGKSTNAFERMLKAVELACTKKIIVVLKGAYTLVAFPNGDVWFNSTGNPGMATAGSGDVLTGVLLGLLSQGYTANDAAILGVYLHGLAGDYAKLDKGENALIASDIIENLGKAFKKNE